MTAQGIVNFSGPPVGFSGPRHLSDIQTTFVRERFRNALLEIRPCEVTSGRALGCDTIGIEEAERLEVPLLRLTLARVRVPQPTPFADFSILKGNATLLDRALDEVLGGSDRWKIEYGKICLKPGAAFLARDDVTVTRSEVLLAAPKTSSEEFRGSGTWATIRRGRKKGIEIRCFPLDGSNPWVEHARERLFS